jgi:CRISPR-associated endonuclease Csn1
MNKLLGGQGKNRGDHRHHAIDALVVALTTKSSLEKLANAYIYDEIHRLRFSKIPPPLDNFLDIANQALENIIISRRSSRKLSGELHDETNYGFIDKTTVTKRVSIETLTNTDLKDYSTEGTGIINSVIRERVLEQLDFLNINDPKKAFSDPKNHPFFITKDSKRIPIHKVKVVRKKSTVAIGNKHRKRYVIPDANHHMLVYETKNSKGSTKWNYEIVTLLEAARRHAKGLPVVEKKPGFLMTLRAGDTVIYEEEGKIIHAWVRTVKSSGQVGLAIHNDARIKKEQEGDGTYKPIAINSLREKNLRKTQIDPLGNVRICRD